MYLFEILKESRFKKGVKSDYYRLPSFLSRDLSVAIKYYLISRLTENSMFYFAQPFVQLFAGFDIQIFGPGTKSIELLWSYREPKLNIKVKGTERRRKNKPEYVQPIKRESSFPILFYHNLENGTVTDIER